jgi:hypothetical protein
MTSLESLDKYGNSFQTKVLGLLLTDRKFLVDVSDSVTEDYFENTARKWIVTKLNKYFDEFHTTPTMEALQIEVKKEDNDVLKIAVVEELKEAYKMADQSHDKEYIEQEFLKFCQNQQMKKAILILFSLGSILTAASQQFSFKMYFKDAIGNTDSITLGYDPSASDSVDISFGEINIISTPLDSGLDVRITDEWDKRIDE